ncbi:MAG: hypothetical protein J0I12_23530 [Candidatus Eremiobacteraeota bacterium]|nr:hypothetical protein [Candidatus Eremiobacteraeota bacterium]
MYLKSLENVDWAACGHAYGSATEVPDQLRALLNPSHMVRVKAHDWLQSHLVHQGTRYPAAVPTIPVLLEMLHWSELPDANQVVDLLAYIAIGDDHYHLVNGFDPAYLKGDVPNRCYQAVLEQMENLLTLYERRPDLRVHLAYLLAWFPKFYPLIKGRLPLAGLSGILALGLLERPLGLAPSAGMLLKHPDPSVRTAAALSCARQPLEPELEKILHEGLANPDLQSILYNEGDWHGWIELVLEATGEPLPDPGR